MKVQKLSSPAYTELYRPQYHYSAYDSWLNDPNGLVYFKGKYHMYYQSNPHDNINEHMTWGHCVSEDLIHWEEKDFVLYPDRLGDIWSGSAYADETNRSGLFKTNEGGIIAAYSTQSQYIGIAYSEDGDVFTKFSDSQPVIDNEGIKDFRDPHLFFDERTGKWVMIIAGGLVRIYTSDDLKTWKNISVYNFNTECPSLFTMKCNGEEKWVLFRAGRGFIVGNFDGKEFIPETEQTFINEGPDAYAGIPFANTGERRIIVNWHSGWKGITPVGRWNGNMTLPFEIELVKLKSGYRMRQNPVKEYKCLEGEDLYKAKDVFLNDIDLSNIKSNCFELYLEAEKEDVKDFSIEFFVGEDHKTVLSYIKESGTFILNRENGPYENEYLSSFSKFDFTPVEDSYENGKLNIRIFADISCVEIFVNNGLYNGSYRINPFSTQQGIKICGTNFKIDELSIKKMKSIHFEESKYPDCVHIPNTFPTTIEPGKEYIIPVYSFSGKEISLKTDGQMNAYIEKDHLHMSCENEGTYNLEFSCGSYFDSIEIVCKKSIYAEVCKERY